MGKVKESIKKHSLSISLFTFLTAAMGTVSTYLNNKHDEQVKRSNDFEVFFSNYQDKIDCENKTQDSILKKINKCN